MQDDFDLEEEQNVIADLLKAILKAQVNAA